MKIAVLLILTVLIAGCGQKNDLFPMELGKGWKYTVTNGLNKSVATLEVVREASVEGAPGFELESELGVFRVAWKGERLIASNLAGTRYFPALPLLVSESPKASSTWTGTISYMGRQSKAKASIVQEPAKLEIGARKLDCVKVVTIIETADNTIKADTYFAPGIGIVQQAQWRGDRLIVSMSYQEPGE